MNARCGLDEVWEADRAGGAFDLTPTGREGEISCRFVQLRAGALIGHLLVR